MLLRFQRRYIEPGIRCFHVGDQAEIQDEALARAYIHHGFAVEVPQPAVAAAEAGLELAPAVAERAVPKRRRETRARTR